MACQQPTLMCFASLGCGRCRGWTQVDHVYAAVALSTTRRDSRCASAIDGVARRVVGLGFVKAKEKLMTRLFFGW